MIETLEVQAPGVFEALANYEHEQLVFCQDAATGLKAIIGIHSTKLGPALGGLRMWNYATEAEAVKDVLRLSRGMTFKNAISGLNLGGGKAVIIGDARVIKSEGLFRKFGQFVNRLNGAYITAEDVGINTQDLEIVAKETRFAAGLPETMGGGGDPSPFTAYSVYLGMKAAAKRAFGSDDLSGKRIAVQGCGHVGYHLIKRLTADGAKLFISDFVEERAYTVASEFKAQVVGLDEIYDVDCDIYAPCALGASINDNTIPRLRCAVIAGAANNQLADEEIHGRMIQDKGIVYAPDFLINAGGVINVYQEVIGYDRKAAFDKVEKIYDYTLSLLAYAERNNLTPQVAAMKIARKRITDGGDISFE